MRALYFFSDMFLWDFLKHVCLICARRTNSLLLICRGVDHEAMRCTYNKCQSRKVYMEKVTDFLSLKVIHCFNCGLI